MPHQNTVCSTTSRIVLKVHDCKGRKKLCDRHFLWVSTNFSFQRQRNFSSFYELAIWLEFQKVIVFFFFFARDRKGLFLFCAISRFVKLAAISTFVCTKGKEGKLNRTKVGQQLTFSTNLRHHKRSTN